ncbi:hypothetical protein [Streptomyces sp. enrichment culture]|uniref:hypothetical protein n=1 Tax=Streptomyces sp. enrichment culture TaxID=1795815 RepID=UPI003F56CDB4
MPGLLLYTCLLRARESYDHHRAHLNRTPGATVRAAFERAFPEGAGRPGQLQP